MSDKKPQRPRVDSPSSVSAAILASGRIVRPPASMELSAAETAVFAEVIAEIPKVDLTDHQIRLAGMLAREIHSHTVESQTLEREGKVIADRHGVPMQNPRTKVVQQCTSTVLSLRRTLGLTARALAGGDSRRVAIRRAHNLASEHMLDDMDDDDLLARPAPTTTNREGTTEMTALERIRALPPVVRTPALEVLDQLTKPIRRACSIGLFREAGFSRGEARRMTLALKRLQVVALVPK